MYIPKSGNSGRADHGRGRGRLAAIRPGAGDRRGAEQSGGGDMSKAFARAFYNSQAWKTTREAYKKQAGFLCED